MMKYNFCYFIFYYFSCFINYNDYVSGKMIYCNLNATTISRCLHYAHPLHLTQSTCFFHNITLLVALC